MKFLGEIIKDAAKEDGIACLDVELGKRLGVSRQAVHEAVDKLSTSTDNIKLFKKYMKALNRAVEVNVKVSKLN